MADVSRRAWLTLDQVPAETICWHLRIPADWRWQACLHGALLLLTEAENWEQYGSLTPEEMAEAWTAIFYDYITGGTGCEDDSVMAPGSIVWFAGADAPDGWLLCDGALYASEVYPELFAAVGYTYGGSGDYFAVPDLRGRMPVGAGSGQGLTPRVLGDTGGEEAHTLTVDELPEHRHEVVQASGNVGAYFAARETQTGVGYTGYTGGGQSHNTMPPYIALNAIIKT